MSADIEIWKAGACQASVSRRAIVLRSDELLDLRLERRRADGGVRWRGRGALDVFGDDATVGAGACERAELDAALARDAASKRRRLQAAPFDAACSLAAASAEGFAATLAFLLARGPGRTLFLRLAFGDLGRLLLRLDLLPGLADDGDPLADLDFLAREDLEQDAAGIRFDLLRHLLGVELVERLALLDLVALLLKPADDRAGLHSLAEPGRLTSTATNAPRSC